MGLGGSGLAAVRAARALGAAVIGVDAGRIAGAAAGRNGGLLLGGLAPFHHDVAQRWGATGAATLYRHTLRALDAMREDTPECTWWHGSLRVAGTAEEEADCARQHAQMQADDLPVAPYNGPEGRGLLFPADGACHPVQRALTLADRAVTEGAELYEHSRVSEIATGHVTLENGHQIHAPVILVCADGALGELLPTLAPRLRHVRLQMLATAPTTDVHIPRPVYARYGYDYWQQLPDGRVLLGGGRDQDEAAEYTRDDRPTAPVQRWLESQLRTQVRTAAPITHRWAATVTYSDNELPIAEAVQSGAWGCGGYGGTGNVVGALCAAGLARRALGTPDPWLDALDALRTPPTTDYSSR